MNQLPACLPPDAFHAIRDLCERLEVCKLQVFGSAITDRFDPNTSDIDFLVEFHDPLKPGIADRYLALAEGLESILQRRVDLVTRQAMKNPVFRQIVEETSRTLYAA